LNHFNVEALLLQALETAIGSVRIYESAIAYSAHSSQILEWEQYLKEARCHVRALESLCEALQINVLAMAPARQVVRHISSSLVSAMDMAKPGEGSAVAQIVAGECVLLAETRNHVKWELIAQVGRHGRGHAATMLLEMHGDIRAEKNLHLASSQSWCRQLWEEALGLPAGAEPSSQTVRTRVLEMPHG
jgi:hypothetical protein